MLFLGVFRGIKACRMALLFLAVAATAVSSASQHDACSDLAPRYQWVLVFGGLFPLPRELVLFGTQIGSHYYEERNYPGKPVTAIGAAGIGVESQYQRDWMEKEGNVSQLARTVRHGSLIVEEFVEPDVLALHYVHITDGHHYVVLVGPVGRRWKELLDAASNIKGCGGGLL